MREPPHMASSSTARMAPIASAIQDALRRAHRRGQMHLVGVDSFKPAVLRLPESVRLKAWGEIRVQAFAGVAPA